jgi:hypothetical protein
MVDTPVYAYLCFEDTLVCKDDIAHAFLQYYITHLASPQKVGYEKNKDGDYTILRRNFLFWRTPSYCK